MATAVSATVSAFNNDRTPATIEVVDDGGSRTTYTVRYDRATTRPADGAALVWDSFYEHDIRVETMNGEPLLGQDGPGLPPECVLLVNRNQGRGAYPPAPGLGVLPASEAGYLFFSCLREG